MKAHLDYLRLATWELSGYPLLMSEIMSRWPADWQQSTWLQYSGWRKEQIFIGQGWQNKRRHAIFQASGSQAHNIMHGFVELPHWYATRVDVQITIPQPKISLEKIHKSLGKKKTTLISSEANQTLYVGARTSDVFTRLYEKPLDKMYLRLEFEIKGESARAVWESIRGGTTTGQIFNYYLGRSILPGIVKKHFDDASADASDLFLAAEQKHDAEKKLKWLESIDNAVMRAITDHEIGPRVKILVDAWSQFAANIDNQDNLN